MTDAQKPQPKNLKELLKAYYETNVGNPFHKRVVALDLSYAEGWNAALKAMAEFEAQSRANEKD